ncbi:heavy metal translocating P-type ATPase [Helicobacter mesocricetorum]|uniref:heavy metal translocating P-type ATPase n=1 Tax=Helicobacter mesocricetorum TaxID=87012 RepID=UPI001F31E9D4|nr:heavy metal translocating P-type ATPase [Helicobacter mesocricetorum]
MENMLCCCNFCSKDTYGLKNNFAKMLLIFSGLLYLVGLIFEVQIFAYSIDKTFLFFLYVFCYFVLGYGILKEAFKGFLKKKFFNENTLMAFASIGAWIIGDGAEAVAILLFYRVGEFLESLVVEKSKKSIQTLASIKVENARILQDDKVVSIDPKNIQKGDILVLLAGDRIPVDGIIIQGESSIDNSSLSGESIPQNVGVGDSLLSGGINLYGVLHIQATQNYENSAFSKIIKLIEEGNAQKSRSEEFITKFARFYTPIVALLAISISVFPPLYFGIIAPNGFIEGFSETFYTWLYRGIVFLVVSCPCALVISIPLTFFASLGRASKEGILIKGSSYLETLFDTKTIIFDKTGTLTKGVLIVKEIQNYAPYDKQWIISLAKTLESHSNHPIAKAIAKLNGEILEVENLQESAGGGISAIWEGKKVALGNGRFIGNLTQQFIKDDTTSKCQVFLALENEVIGSILLEDYIKEEAQEAITWLKNQGYKLHILSGDKESVVKEVAKQVGINAFVANLLPAGKVEFLKKILQKRGKNKVAFVGDGINDAPSLILCDVGIAMGKMGSDLALEGADVVILNDDLRKIPQSFSIAQKTRKILWQNIILALGVKAAIIVFAAFGFANLWIALFGDVGVALLALLNATRAIR